MDWRHPPRQRDLRPASPHRLADLLSDFEKYLNAEGGLPPLVRAGLLHVQFETRSTPTSTARDLLALVNCDRGRVLVTHGSTVMAARLFEMLPKHPVITIATAVRVLETTRPTATKAVMALIDAGVLEEISGKKCDRSFGYACYLDQFKAGTGLEG